MNAPAKFDVFLCHNSEDKPEIWKIYDRLTAQGLRPWIDDEHSPPGQFWLNALGEQIDEIRSVAVFVGGSGIGPWQEQEIASSLGAFVRRKKTVIPVFLPNAPKEPKLPVFLENFTWVDFRKQRPDPMERLIWGITGTKPTLTQNREQTKPVEQNDLRSEKNIDYTKLRDLLKAQRWKEADQETYTTMIRTVGLKEGDSFSKENLLDFSCTDLRTIDGLWVRQSNGVFGFSVQQRIYVACGGNLNGEHPDEAVLRKFGDLVGWRSKKSGWFSEGEWFSSYDELAKDISLSSPKGIFPTMIWWNSEVKGFSSFAKRFMECRISQS